ncbi:MAG: CHASE3 domain-containing protein [Nitrospira sp.]
MLAEPLGLIHKQNERPSCKRTPTFGIPSSYIVSAMVAIVVMLVNATLLFLGTRQVFESADDVAHTHEVLAASEHLLSTLADAETGQRGYVITGVPAYLEPFQAAKARVQGSVDRLRLLTSDNLEQTPAIKDIERLVEDKLGELSETIALRRDQGLEAARMVMMTDQGKRVMDMIRSRLNDINARESALLAAGEHKHQATYELVIIANGLSLVLGLGILLFAYFIVYQDIVVRREADAALRAFSTELEHRVTARTAELVQSQDRLRAMASELNLAEQRERQRLARELHDHLQQLLVVLKIKLGQTKPFADQVPACAILMKESDEVLSEALTYTRTLVADLSPRVLNDHGLAAGLRWLSDYMQKHNLAVTVHAPEQDVRLPDDQKIVLFQSVRELLINASKHAGTGRATVTLDQLDGQLRITVRDDGVGFDIAAATEAIVPHGGISSKFGLFSIRERMRALGGFLELRSAPGKGTTATLVLPVARHVETELSPKVSGIRDHRATVISDFPSQLSSTKIRVLLVDDHIMVRQGLRAMLDAYPDVELIGEAGNGEEAVQLVDQLCPSVVLMDINMPKMNGIEATKAIMVRHPDTIVIALSVNATDTDQEAAAQAGAVQLITKEVAVDQLYAAMQQAMKKRKTPV